MSLKAPTDARGWLALGDAYVKKAAIGDAVAAYREAAVLYHRDGMYLKAFAIYKQIRVIDPTNRDADEKLAELERKLGLRE